MARDLSVAAIDEGKRPALMTHVVMGYPSIDESLDIVKLMSDLGVCGIELQLPFSDPIADGPTIMFANQEAIRAGAKTVHILKSVKILEQSLSCPVFFMTYFNLVMTYGGGVDAFCRDAVKCGASGIIVPDVPFDDPVEDFVHTCENAGIIPVPLVSPVTPQSRIAMLAKMSKAPFVYCVSTTGTTGARESLPEGLASYLRTVRRHFKRPLALGFGISKPEHIDSLRGVVEIAIVGSATIDIIRSSNKNNRLKNVASFLKKLL